MVTKSINDPDECQHQPQTWQTDTKATMGEDGRIHSLEFYCHLCNTQVHVVLEYSKYNPQKVE